MNDPLDVFLIVILLVPILLLAYVTTRFIGNKTSKRMKGRYLQIVETIYLGVDKQIHLLKAGEEFILISAAGKNLEFLTSLKLDGYEADENSVVNNAFDFKNFFEKYVQTYKNKKIENAGNSPANSQLDPIEENSFRMNLNKLKAMTSTGKLHGRKDGDDTKNEM